VSEPAPYVLPPTEGQPSTFTDGAGICSAAVLAEAARMMGKALTPTAIQIRLPGIKGVLALAPEGVLSENEALVRPSMIKLDSDQVVFGEKNSLLNVLKLSSYSPGYLNRQSILLLEAHGISKNVLLSFFHREKARIESIGTSVDGATYYPPLPVSTSTSFTMFRTSFAVSFRRKQPSTPALPTIR
jgi:hypothetical protein